MSTKNTTTTGAASSAAAATNNNDSDIKSPTSKYFLANLHPRSSCGQKQSMMLNIEFNL